MIALVAIIMAAGTGSRMKAGKNKVFLPLCGKPMLLHTVEAFEKSSKVQGIIVVTGKDDINECREILGNCNKLISVIPGGATRQESSYKGVAAAESEYVLIHDGARALITPEEIDKVAEAVIKTGNGAIGVPCVDTMKVCKDGKILSTVDRESLFKIYTPQGFNRNQLLELHIKAKEAGIIVTDDCSLFEWFGETVTAVEGSPINIKLTTPEDVLIAEAVLNSRKNS